METEKNFNYWILGTNIVESIISASLAIMSKKIINMDKNFQYSGELKTLSLKELKIFKEFEENNSYSNLEKIELLNGNMESFNEKEYIDNFGFRNFNIDLKPKLIFSDSYSIEQMASSDFDSYINFITIKDIIFYDNDLDKQIKIPFSKEDIFKNRDFSLIEKKNLYNFLTKVLRFYKIFVEEKLDLNSIKDFEKVIYSYNENNNEKIIKDILNKHYFKIFENFGLKNEKLIKIISYNFGLFERNYKEIDITVYDFLKKFIKYFNSIGVHSKLPFLYPIYGTGDITQTFSRISAVFGSYFIINSEKNKDIIINKEEDNYNINIEYKDTKIKHNEKIIISNCFQKLFDINPINVTKIRRINLIYNLEEKENNEKIIKQTPFIINVSDSVKSLENKNPFIMYYFSKSSENVPNNKIYSHIDYILTENNFDINKFIEFNKINLEKYFDCKFNLEIVLTYIENCEFDKIKYDKNLIVLPTNYNDIDFDNDFLLAKDIIEKELNQKLDIIVNKKLNEHYKNHNIDYEEKDFNETLDKLNDFNF